MLYVTDVYSGSPRYYATNDKADAIIVKATQGTEYVNPCCDEDYQAAKRAGKLLGVYHYAGGGDPVAEAKYFLQNVKGYIGEAILVLDWESNQNGAFGDTNWTRKFVDCVHEQTGVWPIIYVQFSAVSQVANCASDCGLWGAGYPTYQDSWTVPVFSASYSFAPWKTLTGWQFTGNGMDRSVFYLDADGWKALAKGDDAKTTAQPTPQPTKQETKPVTWTDELGDKWTAENGKFTSNTALHLRWGARTTAKPITVLPAGSVVKYDAWSRHGGYVWLRQPRANGQYAYLACRNAKTNEPYGTFS